ncbi:MAG: hypothetical protein HKO93_07185, partial [Flavobacteriales bacterium]|nr:hypothetical protein [Flavobacteriales bacterium]
AKALDTGEIVENKSIYSAGIREMLNIINSIPPEVEKAMLFGHNPTFTDLAHHLDHNFHSHLVTCARVRIDFDVDSWDMIGLDSGTVVSHHYPRMYPEMENL